jgi:spore cortex formation protein SpoVR/YcgB (stage V sporulation)
LDSSRKSGAAYNAEQLKWTSEEIKSSIKTIEWDIQDLEETVRIVEANPQRFHLDAAEVARRKGFVDQAKQKMEVGEKAEVPSTLNFHGVHSKGTHWSFCFEFADQGRRSE